MPEENELALIEIRLEERIIYQLANFKDGKWICQGEEMPWDGYYEPEQVSRWAYIKIIEKGWVLWQTLPTIQD